jgi:UDP-glucose 4-epimerase
VKLLVTGATGFIGQAACGELRRRQLPYRAAVRRPSPDAPAELVTVGEIHGGTDWTNALAEVTSVIHLAGRAHAFGRRATEADEFRRVNVEGTERLARAAAAAGVQRFVLLSSAKVHGDVSRDGPFRETDVPRPVGMYAVSKWEAEQRVRAVAAQTGLSVTIVRTPLVYGPGVKANFLSLMRAVDRRLPLPFGRVHNARSLIFVGNLVDALLQCARHPSADGEVFLIKDEIDLSTAELIRRLARALARRPRLFGVPPLLIAMAASLLGRAEAADRLIGSFVVDGSRIRDRTGWTPPFDVSGGLAATASWYRAIYGSHA